MAGTKTIFNSTALECYRELLLREHGVVLESNYVELSQISVSAQSVVMRVKAVAGPGNLPSAYSKEVQYVYNKVPLSQLVPTDMTYGGTYPCTFTQFRNAMRDSYGWLIEDGELELVIGNSTTVLTGNATVNAVPSEEMAITLNVRTQSGRFRAENGLRVYITSPQITGWTRMVLSGNAPDGVVTHPYTYAYTVTGGEGPFTYSIIGQAPAVLNANTGAFEGNGLLPGVLNWTVRVQDARGFVTDLNDSAEMTVAPFEYTTASPLPTQQLGGQLDVQINTTGGVPPLTHSFVSGRPANAQINAQTGHIYGEAELGSYLIDMRCQDAVGTIINKVFTLNVVSRPHAVLAREILEKVNSWFEFDENVFPDGAVLEAVFSRSNAPNQLTLHGAATGTPETIVLNGQTLTGQQNLITDGGVAVLCKGTNPVAGTGLIGRATDQLGWELYVDELDAARVRFAVQINQQTYGVLSDAGSPMFGNSYALISAQRFDTQLQLHCNGELSASQVVSGEVIDYTTAIPMTIGQRTHTVHQNHWNTQIDRMLFFQGRLWADELVYLYNGGVGRRYLDVLEDAS